LRFAKINQGILINRDSLDLRRFLTLTRDIYGAMRYIHAKKWDNIIAGQRWRAPRAQKTRRYKDFADINGDDTLAALFKTPAAKTFWE